MNMMQSDISRHVAGIMHNILFGSRDLPGKIENEKSMMQLIRLWQIYFFT